MKPVWKSLPIPTKQEGPVKVLVADNFEAEVLKSKITRDVVFYVYAPWFVVLKMINYLFTCTASLLKFLLYRRCGHCKEFDKIYKRLAKNLSSEKLIFTKMDGTGNDLPPGFEIRGYPTIFFIPAFKKHEPLLYDGDRSATDLKVRLHSDSVCNGSVKVSNFM